MFTAKNSLGNKLTTLAFKGDLLKASQVLLVLNTNMSDSIKHIKTGNRIFMFEKFILGFMTFFSRK